MVGGCACVALLVLCPHACVRMHILAHIPAHIELFPAAWAHWGGMHPQLLSVEADLQERRSGWGGDRCSLKKIPAQA